MSGSAKVISISKSVFGQDLGKELRSELVKKVRPDCNCRIFFSEGNGVCVFTEEGALIPIEGNGIKEEGVSNFEVHLLEAIELFKKEKYSVSNSYITFKKGLL